MNTVDFLPRTTIAGIYGAQQAQRLTNVAGWARSGLDTLTARSQSYPLASQSTEHTGFVRAPSRHERCVSHVAWARNLAPSVQASKLMDFVFGSGVHAPGQNLLTGRRTPDARAEAVVDNIKFISKNFSSIGLAGSAVGLLQLAPSIAAASIGAGSLGLLGGVADQLKRGVDYFRSAPTPSNMAAAWGSLGAYLGAGAISLAGLGATFAAPMLLPMVVLPAFMLAVTAPTAVLQAARFAALGVRTAMLGGAYVAALACCIGGDVGRPVVNRLARRQNAAPPRDATAADAAGATLNTPAASVPSDAKTSDAVSKDCNVVDFGSVGAEAPTDALSKLEPVSENEAAA